MPSQNNPDDRIALLQGTLDLLILKTLVLGSCHGQGIARSIQRQSEEVFFVDHGSLYLALQRLEDKKWISAKWGVSENNRKARFYSLTAKGRQQLVDKTSEWQKLTRAMGMLAVAPYIRQRGILAILPYILALAQVTSAPAAMPPIPEQRKRR